jgi:hypothetical protein
MELTLTVKPEQGEPYRATARTLVPMWEVGGLTAGDTLVVRVDPDNPSLVAIDRDPPKEWLEQIGRPTPSPLSADEILAAGIPATAQVVGVQLTGKTTEEVGGNRAHPERDGYPAVILELLVQPPVGAGLTVKAVYSVPPGRLDQLNRGSLLPVRYIDHVGTPLVAVDWEAGHNQFSNQV